MDLNSIWNAIIVNRKMRHATDDNGKVSWKLVSLKIDC